MKGRAIAVSVVFAALLVGTAWLCVSSAASGQSEIYPSNGVTQGQGLRIAGQFGGDVRAVAVQGHYAYVGRGPRLLVWDVSDPAQPTLVGRSAVFPEIVEHVVVAGDLAYVADGEGGLVILNVSTPSSPSQVGAYDTPGQAYDLEVQGSYAYVADGSQGLRILNVTNPAAPSEAGYYTTPSAAYGLAVSGAHAYVASEYHDLIVVDVGTPGFPVEVGRYDDPMLGYATGVDAAGDYLYVADRYRLHIVDISDPANPAQKAVHPLPDAWDVIVSGDRAYV